MNSETLRKRLGTIGVWSFRFDLLDPFEAAEAAGEVERLDFPTLWVPEVGRTEAMSLATHLLASTSDLVIANGIARLSDRSASAAAAAHRYLDAASDGRHVLGLGLGGRLSEGPSPITLMSDYLGEFESAWNGHPGANGAEPVICLAAYNDRMANLAGERTAGVHTYLVNETHTARVREIVGHGPVVAAEMAVVLGDDRDRARMIARTHIANYLGSAAHRRKFASLGFTDDDLADGGSDALVDSLVVSGESAIVERIRAHLNAGADHVGIQVLGTMTMNDDLAAWNTLAGLVNAN